MSDNESGRRQCLHVSSEFYNLFKEMFKYYKKEMLNMRLRSNTHDIVLLMELSRKYGIKHHPIKFMTNEKEFLERLILLYYDKLKSEKDFFEKVEKEYSDNPKQLWKYFIYEIIEHEIDPNYFITSVHDLEENKGYNANIKDGYEIIYSPEPKSEVDRQILNGLIKTTLFESSEEAKKFLKNLGIWKIVNNDNQLYSFIPQKINMDDDYVANIIAQLILSMSNNGLGALKAIRKAESIIEARLRVSDIARSKEKEAENQKNHNGGPDFEPEPF